MTPAFKHRLLGTVILVLAGIIFLPDLLDGEKQVVKDDFKVIPNKPEFQGVTSAPSIDQQAFIDAKREIEPVIVNEVAIDEADEQKESDILPVQQYTQVTTPSAEKAVKSSTVNTQLAEAAWIVGVGSFGNVQNANALVTKLRQAGFVVFTRETINAKGVKLTSVAVGPELKKERLEQQLPTLQKLTGIDRLTIRSYQPTENN